MFGPNDYRPRNLGWARLMECTQNGDKEAFRALVNEIGPVIARFLSRRLADASELEDVCQETLLAVYESRRTYEPARPFEPWLFAIARHTAANHFQRHRSRTSWQELRGELPDDSGEKGDNPLVKLRQALGRLPRFQREAFVMMKIEGLSLIEASERTGASVGTLKVRVHRAFAFVKKSMLG
ncbi:MAG: RNA polymerase sigma factor [Candidatus Binataceae bacterium]